MVQSSCFIHKEFFTVAPEGSKQAHIQNIPISFFVKMSFPKISPQIYTSGEEPNFMTM